MVFADHTAPSYMPNQISSFSTIVPPFKHLFFLKVNDISEFGVFFGTAVIAS